jgi:hypothetical protein
MSKKTKKSIAPREIVAICLKAFDAREDVKTKVLDDREFKVILKDNEYTVELLGMEEIDDNQIGTGSKLGKGVRNVETVKDHCDVLDVCLNALSKDERARKSISDLTTDGDNHDCEAIFHLQDWWYKTLEVR